MTTSHSQPSNELTDSISVNPDVGGTPKTRWLRIFLLAVVVAAVAGLYALSHPMHDFMEYWSAAHLLVEHKNPYSLYEMIRIQKPAGWDDSDPLMFVSPPWALPFLLPLALAKSYSFALIAWTVALIAAMALASRLLMDLYFRDIRISEITDTTFNRCLFAFTFYPVLLCLKFAQTAPVLLLGLAGFLYFEGKRRPVAAGASLALLLIKPQLLYLVCLAVLVWSFHRRQWKVLLSVGVAVVALSGIALLFDPQGFRHYQELAAGPYLRINPSGMPAVIRRALNKGDVSTTYWMQFVLPPFGVAWFIWYWRKHSQNWSWLERTPALVTASVITTAYAWIFDQVVLALPIIALAARMARREGTLPWNSVILYTGLNCALMLLMFDPPLTFIPAPFLLSVLMYRGARSFALQKTPMENNLERVQQD